MLSVFCAKRFFMRCELTYKEKVDDLGVRGQVYLSFRGNAEESRRRTAFKNSNHTTLKRTALLFS